MSDALCGLERELLERPYNWVKKAARDIAFFGAATAPTVVSDKLHQYGVSFDNASVNYSQAKDALNQTTNNFTQQAVGDALTAVDARYDVNHSIHSLNNIGDAAGILKNVVDTSGRLNETFVNNSLAQMRPLIENEIAHYIQFAEDKLTHDMMPYAIIGAAALFLIMFSASYVGAYLALRQHRKNHAAYETRKVRHFKDGKSGK